MDDAVQAWRARVGKDYVRTSTERAPEPCYMSTYSVSNSPGIPTSSWRDYLKRYGQTPSALYCLNDICPGVGLVTGKIAEESVRSYVSVVLKEAGHDVEVKKKALALNPIVQTIPTAKNKQPDGSIILQEATATATIFILEVKSANDMNATTLKLAIHLCQMLASLRNRNSAVQEISGFYFPCGKGKECVIEVTVKWNDRTMIFEERHSCVDRQHLKSRLVAVYKKNRSYWQSTPWVPKNVFFYPMTPSFVTEHFDGGYQTSSGHSIVIICEKICRVFKKPMHSQEKAQLSYLRGRNLPQVGFPLMDMRNFELFTLSFTTLQ